MQVLSDYLATVVGYLVIAGLAVLCLGFGVDIVVTQLLKLRDELTKANEREVANRIGLRLWHDSDWFSEDKDTCSALGLVGRALTEYGGYDVATLREVWRKKRKPVFEEKQS